MATHAMERHARTRAVAAAETGAALRRWAEQHARTHADVGTGDGKYAFDLARRSQDTAVIAIDANLDHLRGRRRRDPPNLRFLLANALDWPIASLPQVDQATITFPFGSLLRGLVESDIALTTRLKALIAPGGTIEVRVNTSALAAGGHPVPCAPAAIARTLRRAGMARVEIRAMSRDEMRAFPSTWGRRLACGREPVAWLVSGERE